jgi:phage terminase large subunit-like protein
LDLASGAADLCAFALYAPDTGAVRCWAFLPGTLIDTKQSEDRAPYREWQWQGHIVALPGKSIDRIALGQWIAEQIEAIDVQFIRADRWMLESLKAEWRRGGLNGIADPLQPAGMGFKDQSPALAVTERAVLDGILHHGKNPLLR